MPHDVCATVELEGLVGFFNIPVVANAIDGFAQTLLGLAIFKVVVFDKGVIVINEVVV